MFWVIPSQLECQLSPAAGSCHGWDQLHSSVSLHGIPGCAECEQLPAFPTNDLGFAALGWGWLLGCLWGYRGVGFGWDEGRGALTAQVTLLTIEQHFLHRSGVLGHGPTTEMAPVWTRLVFY